MLLSRDLLLETAPRPKSTTRQPQNASGIIATLAMTMRRAIALGLDISGRPGKVGELPVQHRRCDESGSPGLPGHPPMSVMSVPARR